MGKTLKTTFDVMARQGATPVLNKVTGSFGAMRRAAATANQALGGLNTGLAMMQRKQQAIMAGGIIGAGLIKAGGMVQEFVGAAVKEAGNLEYELANLRGISGATTKEMEALARAARKAGIETQFSPTQAVQGLSNLAQQGFTANQQLGALLPALLLSGASGGKVPLADAAKLTAQAIKGFGRDAEDASIMVDQMVKTTTKSGLAVDEIAGAMQYASSAAQNMEVDFRSTLATLGLIKNVIPSAEVAGSAFQILTARLSKPLNQRKLKQNLGIDVIDESTQKFRGFGSILLDMADKLGGMASGKRAAIIQEVFGPRGMKAMIPLVTQLTKGITTQTGEVLKGRDAWEYWMAELDEEKVKGFAATMNEMKLNTLNGQLQLLTGSVQTFLGELGKGAAQMSKLGVKAILSSFNTLLTVFQNLPEGLKTGIASFLMIGATVTKFIGILLIARVGLRLFGFSLGSVVLGIGKMLLIAGPLTMLFGGIALGAYGIYKAVSTNFGRAADSTTSFVDKVKMGWKGMIDIIQTGGLREATVKEFEKMGDQPGLVRFFNWFESGWKKAKAFFDGVSLGFIDGLSRLEKPWNKFTDTISRIFDIWTGGASEGLSSTDEWTRKGYRFGDVLIFLAESVLSLMTRFMELGESISKSMSGVSFNDVVDGLKSIVIVTGSVIEIFGYVAESFKLVGVVFDTVGTFIGEIIASIIVNIQGLVDMIQGVLNLNWGQVKQGFAKWSGSFTGEFSKKRYGGGLSKKPYENIDKQMKDIFKTGYTAGPETGGIISLPKSGIVSGAGKYISEKYAPKQNNFEEIARRLMVGRADLMRGAGGHESEKERKKRDEQHTEQINELQKLRAQVAKSALMKRITQVNIDGRRLGEFVEEAVAEEKSDNFENASMVNL